MTALGHRCVSSILTGTDALAAGNKAVVAECSREMAMSRMSRTFLVTSLSMDTNTATRTHTSGAPCYQLPAVLIMYSVVSVCDRFAKQHVSKNNFRIFAKFTADVPYRLPWKWLTPGADVVQDG